MGLLYTGVTSNIVNRVYQHKQSLISSFTEKYNCSIVVYYELFDNMQAAITREKQFKKFHRQRKIKLIESFNRELPASL